MNPMRVTEVLAKAGLVDTTWYTEEACERGTAVHEATALYDEGALDESQPWGDDVALGRLEGWKRFVSECDVEVIESEFEVRHDRLGYIGHADRLIYWNGAVWIIDIKPANEERWHPIQLAAYQQAWKEMKDVTAKRANVYLDAGKYKVIPRESRNDWRVFQAALTVAQWKEASK